MADPREREWPFWVDDPATFFQDDADEVDQQEMPDFDDPAGDHDL